MSIRHKPSPPQSRSGQHLRRLRLRPIVCAVVALCIVGSICPKPIAAADTPALDSDTEVSTSDSDLATSVQSDLPASTSPPGRFFPVETITSEITTILSPASTSGYSSEPVASPRSNELIAEIRAEALRSVPLLDIPLSAEFQYAVFTELCHEDPELFCAIMAIAEKESQFIADLIGDNGESFGIVQIKAIWHLIRMAKYGITDPLQLLDPYLCLQVGIDYLEELMTVYQGSTEITHYLFALYNAGPTQANKWWREQGITSTMYSRHVMPNYEAYLATVTARLAEVAAMPFQDSIS